MTEERKKIKEATYKEKIEAIDKALKQIQKYLNQVPLQINNKEVKKNVNIIQRI